MTQRKRKFELEDEFEKIQITEKDEWNIDFINKKYNSLTLHKKHCYNIKHLFYFPETSKFAFKLGKEKYYITKNNFKYRKEIFKEKMEELDKCLYELKKRLNVEKISVDITSLYITIIPESRPSNCVQIEYKFVGITENKNK